MALLLSAQSLSKSFGARPLFTGLSLYVSEGERIGIIGPNGAGKSTLLRILQGGIPQDEGEVTYRKQLRLGYVPQVPTFAEDATVRGLIRQNVAPEWQEHEKEAQVEMAIGRAGFPDDSAKVGSLSGGWKKRLSIACELVRNPELLLLDEPTNHLDLAGIEWLEDLLASAPFAAMTVTHDRYFLENTSTDIVEVNRVYPGGLFRSKGGYSDFLVKRQEFLKAQSAQTESLENKVAREIEWLRRGAKARTTKSKARIQQAGELMRDLADRTERSQQGSVRIDFAASGRQTKRLLHAEGVTKSLGGRKLFDKVNFTLLPGTKLGLAGANGTGKSTLLKLLSGELQPDAGTIERADQLRVVTFDQNRDQLDRSLPLKRALASHGDSVIYQGKPVHVAAWAARFLFRKEQLEVEVERLSGGEQARVLVAQMMLREADVLLLDEPTNDLDIATLEVLEESLLEFPGALVLVTHDRFLLDRVSTAVLGLDGRGGAGFYADYRQWEQALADRDAEEASAASKVVAAAKTDPASTPKDTSKGKKLSYMEQREWSTLEDRITEADQRVAELQQQLHSPEVVSDPKRLQQIYAELEQAEAESAKLYDRWAELESKQGA
jgi:ABC transport system ATP-binding/permease protein